MYELYIIKIMDTRTIKGCLSERGLSIPEAKECVKDMREWRRIVGGDVDDPGWSRLYDTVKAVDVFDLLRSGIWLIWREKVLCE